MESVRMPEILSPETDSLCRKLIAAEIGNLTSEIGILASESSNRSSEGSNSPVKELVAGEESDPDSVRVNILSHGSMSVIGRSRVMEDALTVAPGREFSFFAVYSGDDVSRVSNGQFQLHQLLANEIKEQQRRRPVVVNPTGSGDGGGEIDWKKVIWGCFEKMDEEGSDWESEFSVGLMALAVVVVGKEELVVANCGDSRVVLSRAGVAMPLSLHHKPNRPDDRERMDAARGRNMNRRGCSIQELCSWLHLKQRDKHVKPYVTSEPEVTVIKRTESDNFLIIGSAGLWDVLSYFIACEVARTCLDCQIRTEGTSSEQAAAMLARLAMAKGSKDNISVIVVELKK